MSGIFGIVRMPGARVTDAELAPMADTLRHRGPDGIRHVVRENAGLGHCMLRGTPEALHEILPFRDEASGLTITADARIDNREQLLAETRIRPARDRIIPDSELILRAYLKWGEACVEHLLGDFGFAIWDERSGALFVARDHMGCKPVYYHCQRGLFVFASSAIAVARVPQVNASVDDGRVADYLLGELEGINKTASWYNNISRMPPAHCGFFRNNDFRCRQYWALEPADLSHLKTDDDYLDAFTELYARSVGCRMRSRTEPAAMLSGGLDSSTIVALARDSLRADGKPPLRTFSAVSEPGAGCQETRSIKAVLAQGNLRATCLSVDRVGDYAPGLGQALELMEDPFDGNWTLLALISLAAAKDGRSMLLTGLDGECAVGAPTNYIELMLREGRWRSAWKEAAGLSGHYYRGDYSARVLYFRGLVSRLMPEVLRKFKASIRARQHYRRLVDVHDISPDFSSRVKLAGRVLEYNRGRSPELPLTLQAWHKQAIGMPDLTVAIERYERLGGYFGLELRHPLLDIRLLRFSAALPLGQKVRGGWSKFILRRLASRNLPDSVAWREGWEQLGWKFTATRAEQFLHQQRLPVKVMNDELLPYLNTAPLSHYHRRVGLENDATSALLELWGRYCLSEWLRSGPGKRQPDMKESQAETRH